MLNPPLLKPHETSIVDSGGNVHFLLVNAPCLNKVKYKTPSMVRLPIGATVGSSHTAELNIPELKAATSIAHISSAWPTILNFQSENYATKAT
jgi:hypothetical protein